MSTPSSGARSCLGWRLPIALGDSEDVGVLERAQIPGVARVDRRIPGHHNVALCQVLHEGGLVVLRIVVARLVDGVPSKRSNIDIAKHSRQVTNQILESTIRDDV